MHVFTLNKYKLRDFTKCSCHNFLYKFRKRRSVLFFYNVILSVKLVNTYYFWKKTNVWTAACTCTTLSQTKAKPSSVGARRLGNEPVLFTSGGHHVITSWPASQPIKQLFPWPLDAGLCGILAGPTSHIPHPQPLTPCWRMGTAVASRPCVIAQVCGALRQHEVRRTINTVYTYEYIYSWIIYIHKQCVIIRI